MGKEKGNTIFDFISEHSDELASLIKGKASLPASKKSEKRKSIDRLLADMQFANLTSVYQTMESFLQRSYESRQGKVRELSSFNQFMKYNLSSINLYFTKAEAASKAQIVAPYRISEGMLLPITLMALDDRIISSLRVPEGFAITDTSTTGKVSAGLLQRNTSVRPGDRLSIVHLIQNTDFKESPQITMRVYDFVLDETSEVPFYGEMPRDLFSVTGDRIGTNADIGDGGVGYVLTRRKGNKRLISPQHIVLTPGYTLYDSYSCGAQRAEAAKSYGADSYYLDPES
ncbi:hypothetical protein EZS27_010298 [termite gut metagenome]|uniref:Uncharacterized protein n=1 Tax=termite gut metagenome TaxID=433724 RepID=A0A5J4S9L9_9ZZZZ